MQLDDKSPVALYYQVERQIHRQIETGELKPGDKIPSENELIKIFNVSRITIRKALERLEEDGMITKKRGSRSIVSSGTNVNREHVLNLDDFRRMEDEMQNCGMTPKANVLEHIRIKPVETIAKLFYHSQEEDRADVIRIRRICHSDGVPIWLESRYFPLTIGEQLSIESLENESVMTLIKKAGGKVGRVEVQVRAVSATPIQAKQLKVPDDFPLLLHESVSYSPEDVTLQVTRVYLRSDYYTLALFAKPQEELSGLDIYGGGYIVKKNTEEIK